ncbi:MAG: SGNH/GDSL hydrolase family protein [Proteobacteria bacterium]|nr:SGNH/GDSL hydrolase family protein [Pseudomonadota bacterium]
MPKHVIFLISSLILTACGSQETLSIIAPNKPSQPDPEISKPSCDTCIEGERFCQNGLVKRCELDADGCLTFATGSCAVEAVCQNGVCVGAKTETPSCQDECRAGERECDEHDGLAAFRICGSFDNDLCLEWSEVQPCKAGESCNNGACSCVSECDTINAYQCFGNGYRMCADFNGDGCYEWNDLTPCAEACENGQCVCLDACEPGARECVGNGYKTCVLGNEGCHVWSDVTECPALCRDGECQCDHKCDANARECSGAGYRVCTSDSMGCRAWSSVVACENGCENGTCKASVPSVPSRYPGDRPLSPVTTYAVQKMKEITAQKSHHSLHFAKIGDSHMAPGSVFMYCFAKPKTPNLGPNTSLQAVIDAYQSTDFNSFSRNSGAAVVGKTASWAVGGYIASEIDATNPRFAFIGYGTNDMGMYGYTRPEGNASSGYFATLQWYYRNMKTALAQMTSRGVIPMVIGTALRNDNTKLNGLAPKYFAPIFDAVGRGLAESLQTPYMNQILLLQDIKNYGTVGDGLHHTQYNGGCDLTDTGMQYGANVRNRYAIEMLDRAWRAVINGEKAPDVPIPFEGKGTKTAPYQITSLPYTHTGSTKSGEKSLASYGCNGTNEAGPEIYYRLDLTAPQKIRAFVVSDSNTNADIVMLKSTDGSGCLARGDIWVEGSLAAGTYYFVIDTPSDSKAGEYLFGIVTCMSGDPLCGAKTTGG